MKKRMIQSLTVCLLILNGMPVLAQKLNELDSYAELFNSYAELFNSINKEVLEVTGFNDQQEQAIGTALRPMVIKNVKPTQYQRFSVGQIFQKIKSKTHRPLNYNFVIAADAVPNAYTIVGGTVVINSGLLDLLSHPNELAFVIGHEISHNELKHCIHKVQYGVIASQIDPILGEIVSFAYSIYNLPFAKQDEYEADSQGVRLMQSAGYNKNGALSFFDKLHIIESKFRGRAPLNDFISSHAPADKRKARLK